MSEQMEDGREKHKRTKDEGRSSPWDWDDGRMNDKMEDGRTLISFAKKKEEGRKEGLPLRSDEACVNERIAGL